MSDPYPPPPPYERSPENDRKISESLQQTELSKKTPIHDDTENVDWEQTKQFIALQNKALMEVPVKPLHIQKRPFLPSGRGLRGPRPLPPCPVDSKLQSAQAPRLKSALEAKMREQSAEEHLPPAPPPFTSARPSSPYYQDAVGTSSPSHTFSPHHSPFDIPRHNSRYSATETYNDSPPRTNDPTPPPGNIPSRTRTRLAFDPSVAYSLNDQWNNINESRAVDPTFLYSSSVSPHVHRTALSHGSRYPYVSNRVSAHSRPLSHGTTFTQNVASQISLQSATSLSPPSTRAHCNSPPPAVARHSLARWAASESDIAIDIYRR